MLVYSEEKNIYNNFSKSSISKIDPTKMSIKHYENFLYLKFIETNGTFQEKGQAKKEIAIAERKIEFWKRQESFINELFLVEIEKLKKNWKS